MRRTSYVLVVSSRSLGTRALRYLAAGGQGVGAGVAAFFPSYQSSKKVGAHPLFLVNHPSLHLAAVTQVKASVARPLFSLADAMFSAAQNMAVSLGNRGMAVSGLEGFDGSDSPCRGTPRGASSSVGVGAVSGLKMGGFGGGCNSPQVRVPASASGQGTVAVGSPNPRAVSKQNSFLRAHPAVSTRRALPCRGTFDANAECPLLGASRFGRTGLTKTCVNVCSQANNESVGAGVQLTTSRPALNAKSVGTMKRKRPPALSISNGSSPNCSPPFAV